MFKQLFILVWHSNFSLWIDSFCCCCCCVVDTKALCFCFFSLHSNKTILQQVLCLQWVWFGCSKRSDETEKYRHTQKKKARNVHWLKKSEKKVGKVESDQRNFFSSVKWFDAFLSYCCVAFVFLIFCICFYFAIIIVCHEPNKNNNHEQTKTVESNRRNFIFLCQFFFCCNGTPSQMCIMLLNVSNWFSSCLF